jgi:hypothetical protein
VKKKTRILPTIEGVKAPVFFHKDPKKAELALLASFITESRKQGWKKSEALYELHDCAARKGELGTLQKFLDSEDCETITDGKVFNAYKLALAESDEFFSLLTIRGIRGMQGRSRSTASDGRMTNGELGEMLWMFGSVHDFAYFLGKYAATPPTLASVRDYFGRAYPLNAGLWPNDKNTNHDMARKFRKWKLPLTPGKAGRPRNRGKLHK